jgi:hypothetical protein
MCECRIDSDSNRTMSHAFATMGTFPLEMAKTLLKADVVKLFSAH